MTSFDEPSILSEYNRWEKLNVGVVLAVVTFWLFAHTGLERAAVHVGGSANRRWPQ
jgi:hypothetical protein